MFFIKKEKLNEEELQLKKEYDFFINLGNGEALTKEQCLYIDNLEYDEFNRLLGEIIKNNYEFAIVIHKYYSDNIYKPGIEKSRLLQLYYADDYLKDEIELMLSLVKENIKKELLLEIGRIYTATSNTENFKEKMINISSSVFYKIAISNEELLTPKTIRNIISECVDSKLKNETYNERQEFKQIVFILVEKFKNNIIDNTNQKVDLVNYLDELIENEYKEKDEFKRNVFTYNHRGTKYYAKVFRVRSEK